MKDVTDAVFYHISGAVYTKSYQAPVFINNKPKSCHSLYMCGVFKSHQLHSSFALLPD